MKHFILHILLQRKPVRLCTRCFIRNLNIGDAIRKGLSDE